MLRRRWPWINFDTVLWAVILGGTWALIALASCLRGDWVTGAIQLGTGVILVAATLRMRYGYYQSLQARAAFVEAAQRANQALWLCLTLMHYMPREGQPDPDDVKRHTLN